MKKKIIGLVGEIASGKGTVSKYLQEKYGAKSYRFSDSLRNILDVLHLNCDRENMSNLSLSLRQTFGEDVLSHALIQSVQKDEHETIVLDGIRREEELGFLKKLEGFKLVYVECDMESRFKRIVERGENVDDKAKTLEEFKKDHERDAEMRIRQLKDFADAVIENDGTLEDLHKKVDELMGE